LLTDSFFCANTTVFLQEEKKVNRIKIIGRAEIFISSEFYQKYVFLIGLRNTLKQTYEKYHIGTNISPSIP
jgi:hypothetical protein